MTKLAIVEEREEDKYEHVLSLRHYRAAAATATALDASNTIFAPAEGIAQTEPHVRALVDGAMKSLSSARQQEVQAWEEELIPCEHTLTLTQLPTGHIAPSGEFSFLPLHPRLILVRAGY
jgi:ubiquitin carboxyl-terminal hydrolase 5/13